MSPLRGVAIQDERSAGVNRLSGPMLGRASGGVDLVEKLSERFGVLKIADQPIIFIREDGYLRPDPCMGCWYHPD